MSAVPRPAAGDFAPFYAGYVELIPGEIEPGPALAAQGRAVRELLAPLDEARAAHRYAPGKWSVKQVLGHVTDAERIFTYRLLRIARGDETPLPGWDEKAYGESGGFDARPLGALLAEWDAVRAATMALVAGLAPDAWRRRGTANSRAVSAGALLYVLLGHAEHHLEVLRTRYGLRGE